MGFDNFPTDENQPVQPTVAVPEESSNRTFLMIALALGAIAVLAMACIFGYALVARPRYLAQQNSYAQTQSAQKTEVERIVALTATSSESTAIASGWTPTPIDTPILPTPTPTSSPTPVVAVATTETAGSAPPGPADATATALHATLEANATLYVATLTAGPTLAAVQPTGMPQSGFADEVGLPSMLGSAGLLIVVIFLARRLRTA